MELSSSEDIDAPIAEVFEKLTTFGILEEAAIRRGARVQHREETPLQGLGAVWDVAFVVQGKERDVVVEITQITAPTLMRARLTSNSIEGAMVFGLLALSEDRTRLTVSLELRPLTLTMRLLVKSLSLAQGGVEGRFQAQVARMVAEFRDQGPTTP